MLGIAFVVEIITTLLYISDGRCHMRCRRNESSVSLTTVLSVQEVLFGRASLLCDVFL